MTVLGHFVMISDIGTTLYIIIYVTVSEKRGHSAQNVHSS